MTLSLKKFSEIAYGEWWKLTDTKEAGKYHDRNVKNVKDAIEYHNKKDRPLNVLVVYGSSRDDKLSAANEISNSKMLLDFGLKEIENKKDIEIDRVHLREYKIEPCNSCLSVSTGWCHFPCSCYPNDPQQELYPKVLKADVLLIATPINMGMVSSRLKLFIDRLISVDGGYFLPEGKYESKTAEFKARTIAKTIGQPVFYDQRMFGRVCAYFISSKDEDQSKEFEYGYVELVSQSLKRCFEDFGCFHANKWFCVAKAKIDEDYSYDKQRLNENIVAQNESKELVKQSIALANKLKDNPPVFKPDRKNRT